MAPGRCASSTRVAPVLAVSLGDGAALLAVAATLATALIAHAHRLREWRFERRHVALSAYLAAVTDVAHWLGRFWAMATAKSGIDEDWVRQASSTALHDFGALANPWQQAGYAVNLVCGDRVVGTALEVDAALTELLLTSMSAVASREPGRPVTDDEAIAVVERARSQLSAACDRLVEAGRADVRAASWQSPFRRRHRSAGQTRGTSSHVAVAPPAA